MKYFKLLTAIIFSSSSELCFAQHDAVLGGWNTFNFKVNFNKRWSALADYQMRSDQIVDRFYYLDYKMMVGYKLTDKWQIGAGAGRYIAYNEDFNFQFLSMDETRIWQQLSYTDKLGRMKIDNRIRVEQRFLSGNYQNRFRYRLQLTYPIKDFSENRKLYVTAYEEIFFRDKSPYFARSRFHAGMGYQFSKNFDLQLGVLNQTNFDEHHRDSKNFAALSLIYVLNLY